MALYIYTINVKSLVTMENCIGPLGQIKITNMQIIEQTGCREYGTKGIIPSTKIYFGKKSAKTDASHYRDNNNSESGEYNSEHLEIDWLSLKEEGNN